MKRHLVLPILGALACAAVISFGQSPSPSPSGTPILQRSRAITPEERAALIVAGQKAREDPKVQAAAMRMHAAAMAFNAAMVARDASLGPILQKIDAANSEAGLHIRLTADDREQLRAAREAMRGTPEAAALQQATADYRKTASDAMTAADPSLSAIIARLPQPGGDTRIGRIMAPVPPGPAASPSASP